MTYFTIKQFTANDIKIHGRWGLIPKNNDINKWPQICMPQDPQGMDQLQLVPTDIVVTSTTFNQYNWYSSFGYPWVYKRLK